MSSEQKQPQRPKVRYYLAKRVGKNWSLLGYAKNIKEDLTKDFEDVPLIKDGKTLSDLKKEATASTMAIPFGVNMIAPGHFYQVVMDCKDAAEASAVFSARKDRTDDRLIGQFGTVHWLDEMSKKDIADVLEE